MGGFPDIIVDPYLVCLPQSSDKVEDLDDFVENLLAWSDLLRREEINVYFPSSCLEALIEEDQYPYGHKIKQMMGRLGITHLSDDLVCRVAQGVLERTPTLEERCAMNIAMFDEGSCRVDPEVYITRLAARIGWGLKHGLVVIACFQQSNPNQSGFLLASAKSVPKEIFEDREIEISARVEAVDFTAADAAASMNFPLEIRDSLPVAFSRQSVLEHLGSLRLWGDAASPAQAIDAIDVRVEELLTGGTGNREKRRAFRFGDQFLTSARQRAFGSRSDLATNLIESCARILIDVPKNRVNPFRVSEEATAAQRRRQDGALAYRTHLTKSGAGFRLMYWELNDRTIEFANVGTKFELEIF
jgi:hypothetical protein